jgi:branched-chain amino acid transport system ATP-binding protein
VEAVLEVENLQAGYGSVPVLFDVSLRVEAGSLVTLLGRNGVGKTTTVRAIMGQIGRTAKRMTFHGVSIVASTSDQVARAGVGLVPEGRRIFRTLSVYENLIATAADRRKAAAPWTLERVYNLFPRMRERTGQYAGTLSGGEQQMLAIGRALMTNPELLILDRISEKPRTIDPGDRQGCSAADAFGGPPLHDRERPHRLERNVAGAFQ